MITTEQIKKLRERTGISIMQCKKALEESAGDMGKAVIVLSKKSSQIADKKADRNLGSGVVQSYIHADKSVGTMLQLLCETDFVAKNEEFQALAYNLAMHITATNPKFLKKEDISDDEKEKVKEVFANEVAELAEKTKQPAELQAKILQGKLDAYFGERILLEQPYIKDPAQTIDALIKTGIQKFGEKIEIGAFVRYSIH